MADMDTYPARLRIDYPERLDRLSTCFRPILAVPVLILLAILTASSSTHVVTETGRTVRSSGIGISGALAIATALMIVVRQRYPRWWFDFALEFTRFGGRVGAYLTLLTDRYPSTVDEQSVHIEVDYPEVTRDLKRWLPLVKWFLAIPHFVVLTVLAVGACVAVLLAWFAILFTGRYPKGLFEFVVGVGRWALRVQAYAFLLVTDRYPPFTMA